MKNCQSREELIFSESATKSTNEDKFWRIGRFSKSGHFLKIWPRAMECIKTKGSGHSPKSTFPRARDLKKLDPWAYLCYSKWETWHLLHKITNACSIKCAPKLCPSKCFHLKLSIVLHGICSSTSLFAAGISDLDLIDITMFLINDSNLWISLLWASHFPSTLLMTYTTKSRELSIWTDLVADSMA